MTGAKRGKSRVMTTGLFLTPDWLIESFSDWSRYFVQSIENRSVVSQSKTIVCTIFVKII